MRKIYCKATEQRRRKFQIYTSIVEDNGERYVTKEAVFEEGKEHISHIFDNYTVLNSLHPGKVVEAKRIEDQIRFPFIEGLQYEEGLEALFASSGAEDRQQRALSEWKQFIIGKEENIVPFDNHQRFQEIFGDGSLLLGDAALKITNFDCIAENIIVTDRGERFIDYEWVFDFPIPLDLCIFRVLQIFSLKNNIPLSKLLKLSGIEEGEKTEVYEKMLDSFNLYTAYEDGEDILYSGLGKAYKEPKILSNDRDRQLKFEFPDFQIEENCKIILYGAGEVGQSYHKYLKESNYIPVGWVDKQYKKYEQFGCEVHSVDCLFESEFDYILLAIYNDKTAREIIAELTERGIAEERIIWKKPRHI